MKNQRKGRKAGAKRKLLWLGLAIVVLISISGAVLAKYVASNRNWAQLLSSDFHISSNYLELSDKQANYTVASWGTDGITFELYNYEKENVALVAGSDIYYTVEADSSWKVTVTENGTAIAPDEEGRYKMPGNGTDLCTHVVTMTPIKENMNSAKVTVNTTAPYTYSLTADFALVGQKLPDYVIEDKGNFAMVTLHSNDYNGTIQVSWSDDFSPDNTDARMVSWRDSSQPVSMQLSANTTYELYFVKNTENVFSKKTVTGTQSLEIKE